MKLSENTINILKNFASINTDILVNPGNVLKTMAGHKGLFAKTTVEESFPVQFAFNKLNEFLGVISLFKDPELEFGPHQATIKSGRQSVNYTYTDPSMVVAPRYDKDVVLPSTDIEFSITQEELQRMIRAAGVLQLTEIAVVGDGERMAIGATNVKNPTTNHFSIDVGEAPATNKFRVIFKVDNIIRLLSADYNVKISARGLSQFTSENVVYFVATEADSTFPKKDSE